jgi:hypothetical protein
MMRLSARRAGSAVSVRAEIIASLDSGGVQDSGRRVGTGGDGEPVNERATRGVGVEKFDNSGSSRR